MNGVNLLRLILPSKADNAMKISTEEILRKLLHLLALLMPIGIFYAPYWSFPRFLVPVILLILFLLSIIIEMLRFKMPAIQKAVLFFFGHMMRKEERFVVSGWTWVIGSAFLCSVLFKGKPHLSFMALSLFILGDAMAALIGIAAGKIKIGKKTLEGSIACFITCISLFILIFPLVPRLLEACVLKRGFPILTVLITSFTVTFFELIPLKISPKITINDNLAVPVITGYIMLALEYF
jgi:dolichol kinase